MKKIIVYTTHCPMCIKLENTLKEKNIEYETITDIEEIRKVGEEVGISSLPFVSIDGKFLVFNDVMRYLVENC